MRSTLSHRASLRRRATFAPWRALMGAATVVMLLALLFAGAILAALHPYSPDESSQPTIEGGL